MDTFHNHDRLQVAARIAEHMFEAFRLRGNANATELEGEDTGQRHYGAAAQAVVPTRQGARFAASGWRQLGAGEACEFALAPWCFAAGWKRVRGQSYGFRCWNKLPQQPLC